MDEPSTGLDAATRRLLFDHIERVRQARGTSILWATHLVDEVGDADRIVLISRGEVLAAGTPAELVAKTRTQNLTDAYIALTGVTSESGEPPDES